MAPILAAPTVPARRFGGRPRALLAALALLAGVVAGGGAPASVLAQGTTGAPTPAVSPATPLPAPDGASAQVRTVTADTPDATRDELQAALARAEARGASQARDAQAIRTRLANGDFRAGDRFVMVLATDSVVNRELVVRDSSMVDLPPLASLSLRGVLRSELQGTLLRHMRRYYRNPDVRVQFVTRVVVSGGVNKPGVYQVPPEATVNEVLQQYGGGPIKDAQIGKVEAWRYDKRVLDQKAVANAVRNGTSIAQLGIQSGDEFRVPVKKERNWLSIVWPISIVISTLLSVLFLIRQVNQY